MARHVVAKLRQSLTVSLSVCVVKSVAYFLAVNENCKLCETGNPQLLQLLLL